MIELIRGLPDDVVGLEAVGEVSSDDYSSVAIPAVEGALSRHKKISLIHVLGERFTGYTAGGELDDAKLGLMHPLSWKRLAVVTDLDRVRKLVKNAGWMIPGEMKLFSNAQRAEAEAWVSAGPQEKEKTVADTFDVIMAAYPKLEAAQKDFDALVGLVKQKKVRTEGVILIERDENGEVRVNETGDDLGRKGLGWGGGVGVLVGLAAPPLLASAAVGAAAGGLIGKFTHRKVQRSMESGLGEKLKPGTAAVVAMVDDQDRLATEQALAGTPAKSVATMDKKGVRGLKDSLAEAALKFVPDRTELPIPDPTFGGTIGRSLRTSSADWTINMTPTAPEGAPNILLVLIDDAGFGNPSTFGGPIETPTLTRVAQAGLSYDHFHVTALCSPTRAALLTGRNHHTVGFGSVGEFPGPFPGYTSSRPKDCAPFVRMLQGNGYSTGGFGKWHLTPDHVQGMAGPFDRWPNAWGFDHFWGFLGGESGQYDPVITQDNTVIGVPEGKDGVEYYFPDDLTDKTVSWLHAVRAEDPTKPWFAYYSTGCSHAPHQVPAEWSDKYKGRFDAGWDAYREETFARQKKLGVIPADAELTPRPDEMPAWDSLSDKEKKLYARQMEIYAGYSANADWNVGRLLDAVDEMGELDNTLVIYIWGDNGASMEGTLTGSFNELTMLNGVPLTPEQQLSLIEQYGGLDAWGTDATAPHYSAAWAWAGNCPFQWGKQVASHLGGTRDGMVVSWPRRIKEAGKRSQFTHVIDVGPMILEAAGIPEAKVVDGVTQKPMEGTSFLYTFEDATAAERHTQQYFEIFGNRAMYKDGWWACSRLDKKPWDLTPPTVARFAPDKYDPENDVWELYYLPDDFSQARDLASQQPEKLAELKKLFWEEAEKHKVLPLLAGFSVFFGILPPMPTATKHTFYGDVENVLAGMLPRIYGQSYAITADVRVPEGGAEGVILAEAEEMGGFSLFVQDGKLRHTYSMLGVETYRQESTETLPAGDVTVRVQFDADEPKPGTGGNVTLWVGDRKVGEGRMDKTVPFRFSGYAGMDVGRDNGLPVDREAYGDKSPFPFNGTVKRVTFDLAPDLKGSASTRLHEAHSQMAAGHAVSG